MFFDFDYYKDKEVAIHCKSKTQAKKFCRLAHKNGIAWNGQHSCYNNTSYFKYKEDTCYAFDSEGVLTHAPIAMFQYFDYTIIEFEDIIAGKYDRRKKMFTKKDLRNGDYVKLRNGERGVYIINGGFTNNTHSLGDSAFHSDLTYRSNSNFDIVEVRRLNNDVTPIYAAFTSSYNDKIIYKRKEQKLWNGMTYEEAHRALWNALADGEVLTKREWFVLNNKNKEDIPKEHCFACAVAASKSKHGNDICKYCPLCNIEIGENCLSGLYAKWCEAKGFEKFKLAHEIANLPWKEK